MHVLIFLETNTAAIVDF